MSGATPERQQEDVKRIRKVLRAAGVSGVYDAALADVALNRLDLALSASDQRAEEAIRERVKALCVDANLTYLRWAQEEAGNPYEAHAHKAAAHAMRMFRDNLDAALQAMSPAAGRESTAGDRTLQPASAGTDPDPQATNSELRTIASPRAEPPQ